MLLAAYNWSLIMNYLNKILRKKLPAPYILSSNLDEFDNRPWREVVRELVPLVFPPLRGVNRFKQH